MVQFFPLHFGPHCARAQQRLRLFPGPAQKTARPGQQATLNWRTARQHPPPARITKSQSHAPPTEHGAWTRPCGAPSLFPRAGLHAAALRFSAPDSSRCDSPKISSCAASKRAYLNAPNWPGRGRGQREMPGYAQRGAASRFAAQKASRRRGCDLQPGAGRPKRSARPAGLRPCRPPPGSAWKKAAAAKTQRPCRRPGRAYRARFSAGS